MVTESRYGLMVPSMKDTGSIIRLMVREHSSTQMATYTMENGKKIKLMVMVSILMSTEPNMKDIGTMIYNMELVERSGLMEVVMMAHTKME